MSSLPAHPSTFLSQWVKTVWMFKLCSSSSSSSSTWVRTPCSGQNSKRYSSNPVWERGGGAAFKALFVCKQSAESGPNPPPHTHTGAYKQAAERRKRRRRGKCVGRRARRFLADLRSIRGRIPPYFWIKTANNAALIYNPPPSTRI